MPNKLNFVLLVIFLFLISETLCFSIQTEIFEEDVFRNPDGTALILLPSLDEKKWTMVRQFGKDNWRKLIIYHGNLKTFSSTISIVIPSQKYCQSIANDIRSMDMAGWILSLAAQYRKKNTFYSEPLKPSLFKTPNCAEAGLAVIKGTYPRTGASLISILIGYRQDETILWMEIEAVDTDYKNTMEVIDKITDGLYMGNQIPKLQDSSPHVRLEGIYFAQTSDYQGKLTELWIVADRRGYLHRNYPSSLSRLDLDIQYLKNKSEVYAYELKNNRIALSSMNSGEPLSDQIELSGKELKFKGKLYKDLMQYKTDGMKLDARYEYNYYYTSTGYNTSFSYSEEKTFDFSSDGSYSFASTASSNFTADKDPYQQSNDQMKYGDFTTKEGMIDTWNEGPNDKGFYKIEGNHLILKNNKGALKVKPIFLMDQSGAAAVIGGNVYLRK